MLINFFSVGEFAEVQVKVFGGGVAFEKMSQMQSAIGREINADVVLIKGSRSAGMERVVDVLSDKNNERGNH